MKILLVILFSLGFSSCMHWGMMGVGSTHHTGQMHTMTTSAVLEKEVTAGDLKAIAVFPNLEFGKDVILTLKLVDAKTSSPISDARVYFETQYVDPTARDDQYEWPYHTKRPVVESRVPGVYAISYGTVQRGEHRLIFHIIAIGKRELEPEIVVETTRVLSSGSQEHHGGMMDGIGTTPALMIGAASMGFMMIAMLVAGSKMFDGAVDKIPPTRQRGK